MTPKGNPLDLNSLNRGNIQSEVSRLVPDRDWLHVYGTTFHVAVVQPYMIITFEGRTPKGELVRDVFLPLTTFRGLPSTPPWMWSNRRRIIRMDYINWIVSKIEELI